MPCRMAGSEAVPLADLSCTQQQLRRYAWQRLPRHPLAPSLQVCLCSPCPLPAAPTQASPLKAAGSGFSFLCVTWLLIHVEARQ